MKPDPLSRPARTRRLVGAGLAFALLVAGGACINTHSDRGVEARWHDVGADAFEPGKTTRSQVLSALGPPSQILSHGGGSAFYYMLETTEARGLILIFYNNRKERTSYDRAVFFFDEEEVLTDFALSAAAE